MLVSRDKIVRQVRKLTYNCNIIIFFFFFFPPLKGGKKKKENKRMLIYGHRLTGTAYCGLYMAVFSTKIPNF